MKLRAGNKEFENNLKMTLNIAINLENRSKEIEWGISLKLRIINLILWMYSPELDWFLEDI